jgi:hypothetical protein
LPQSKSFADCPWLVLFLRGKRMSAGDALKGSAVPPDPRSSSNGVIELGSDPFLIHRFADSARIQTGLTRFFLQFCYPGFWGARVL